MGMGGVVQVAVIIQKGKLIAHINQWDAAKSCDQGMAHQNPLHGHFAVMFVAGL